MLTFDIVAAFNLSQVEVQPGFSLALLKLISDGTADGTLRMAAAIYFKNYVKRHWVPVRYSNVYSVEKEKNN